MQKVIFLDRDGVINSDVGHYYIFKPEQFVINIGLVESLLTWQNKGYTFIVVSNQGGIARGTYTKDDVEKVHAKMKSFLAESGITLTEIYYCPHHHEFENCLCRKPNSVLFEKAIARFNVDVKNSYMIGDNQKDIEAAAKVGIKGILVSSNANLKTIVTQIM